LYLWRHQQDRVLGRIYDREQDDHLLTSINYPADTGTDSVTTLRFFAYALSVQDRQRCALLLCEKLVKAATLNVLR
jgi:hypothetical protein